ncbi:nuclear transport factor 2-like protein [Amycolatopsis panacis]|uniref:Nuclear transport factor 2 family protein n=1 Tax=Amycolatopsis panacis TaxID=2340917 RepID=A0A419IAB5_9PSEU|nr:nuclear transport factor 2 family protein [Amycolatopsis panacis]RJQ90040.1 nuclear transport factor 2 family protein [Amycolatopsis panacis]
MAACDARDIEGLLTGFTDDTVWVTGTSVARGRAELTELFGSVMVTLPPTLTAGNVRSGDDRIAAQPTERLSWDGVDRESPIARFCQLEGDRIASGKIDREGRAELG